MHEYFSVWVVSVRLWEQYLVCHIGTQIYRIYKVTTMLMDKKEILLGEKELKKGDKNHILTKKWVDRKFIYIKNEICSPP